jgi:hypothetical protein
LFDDAPNKEETTSYLHSSRGDWCSYNSYKCARLACAHSSVGWAHQTERALLPAMPETASISWIYQRQDTHDRSLRAARVSTLVLGPRARGLQRRNCRGWGTASWENWIEEAWVLASCLRPKLLP